ncbi:MAG TPA: DUF4236 domain-containing protein [Anaerolineales bacterium]
MPVRFRRTFKILPGVRLNVSKHGISTTVGGRGMHLTFNRYGVRQSLGLPGTGLSEYSYIIGGNRSDEHETPEAEAERHVRSIHRGEGLGCQLHGCGCLLALLLVAGVAAYFGADALKLHPATYIDHLLAGILHSLTVWVQSIRIPR